MPAWHALRRCDANCSRTSSTSPAGSASTSPNATTSPPSRSASSATIVVYVFVRGYLPALVVTERARAVPAYTRVGRRRGELVVTDGQPDRLSDHRSRPERRLRAVRREGHRDRALRRAAPGGEPRRRRPAGARREQEREGVHPAGERARGAHQGAAAAAYRASSFLTWQVSNVCVERRRDGSLLPTKDAADERRTRSTRSTRCCWRSRRCWRRRPTPAYEPRMFFSGGVMSRHHDRRPGRGRDAFQLAVMQTARSRRR